MATDIIGMYGAVTGGTEDAIAQVDIPEDGTITGIDWDVRLNLDADAESMDVELSFISTNQLTTNDVRGRISSISSEMALVTSGVAINALHKFVPVSDLRVAGGERLYLHAKGSSGVTGAVRCNVHLDTRTGSMRRSQRRR